MLSQAAVIAEVIRRAPESEGLMPKEDELFDGSPSVQVFRDTGLEFFRHMVELGGLQPHHRVLDIGSGSGRMAVPLTRYLTEGSYEGIDPVMAGVEWCKRVIEPGFPNFKFHHVDFYSKYYNPHGKVNSEKYTFPYSAGEYDFILLTSVFTHLLPKSVKRYMSEISRLLKPGGTLLGTMFLLNERSERFIQETNSPRHFPFRVKEAFVQDPSKPEGAVAYKESFIRELLRKNGLQIVEPIRFGKWSGDPEGYSYQDIVVAKKA